MRHCRKFRLKVYSIRHDHHLQLKKIKLCGQVEVLTLNTKNKHCCCCNFVVIALTGVERAACSCADPASKLGRCKHAVGLLLWCKNEKNVRYLEAML